MNCPSLCCPHKLGQFKGGGPYDVVRSLLYKKEFEEISVSKFR